MARPVAGPVLDYLRGLKAGGKVYDAQKILELARGVWDTDQVNAAYKALGLPRTQAKAPPEVGRGLNAQSAAEGRKGDVLPWLQAEYQKQLPEYAHVQAEAAKDLRAGTPLPQAEQDLQGGLQDGYEAARARAAAAQAAPEPHGAAEPAAPGDASESGHAGDPGGFDPAEFESPGGQPGGAAAGGVAEQLAKDVFAGPGRGGRSGQITLPPELVAKVQDMAQKALDGLGRLAGKMYPAIHRLDRASGEAVARLSAAPAWARLAAEHYADKVMWPGATEQDRRLAGAVLTERRLRYMRQAFQQAAAQAAQQGDAARAKEMADNAAKVTSVIGKQGSPLAAFGDYRAALQSPHMQDLIRRWVGEFVPVMDELYRKAQGIAPQTPIDSLTQIPGQPINLKPLREGEDPTAAHVFTGAGRGNLRNVQFKKLKFSVQATGAADAYDVDLGHIIENSLVSAAKLAAQADAARVMVANGIGSWEQSGAQAPGFREVPFTRPPPGTQANQADKVSFYVREEGYKELRSALDVDEPGTFVGVLRGVFTLPTAGALASSVEAAYHSLNLAGGVFAPGMRWADLYRNAVQRVRDSRKARERLLTLAEMGATRPPKPDAGLFVGGINKVGRALFGKELPAAVRVAGRTIPTAQLDPTHWAGRGLEAFDEVMRLTASDAFDRLVQKGEAPNAEAARRDFLNQLFGQYDRKAQNSLVAFLRDTGIGPFATAASTMTARSLRMLAGGGGPKATSAKAAAAMRAAVFAKIAAILGGTFALNYAWWGRWDGDDETPFGALKVGVAPNGKTVYIETHVSLIRRGLRAVGLLAIIEGKRQGKMPGEIAQKGIKDAILSFAHPAMGPGPQVLWMGLTGQSVHGVHVAEHAKAGENQYWNNAKAAFGNFNPAVAALAGLDVPSKEQQEWYEKVSKLAGPWGPHFRGAPKPARR